MNLYEACLEKFGVITAVMILADFSGFMADFNRANEEELKELIAPLNKDKDTDQIKSFVLEETGVETFGISTIGQAMLTAYAAYANSYVAFKHSFNMLVSGEEYEENQVMAFWGLYADNTDFQHIDFHIMFYDNAFHEGDHETLLGKKILTSPYMPEIAAGAKVIMFGDLSFYWIGDRQGITFKRLNERYADMGQVGFLASKRVDGKLVLPEAIKVLQMKGAAGA